MTNPIMGWFYLTLAYNGNIVMTIKKLDIIWINRYYLIQELHTTMDLESLVQSFRIINNIE